MTTDDPAPRARGASPRGPSPREAKLYVAAALALCYGAAAVAVVPADDGVALDAASTPAPVPEPAPPSVGPAFVWLDELPAATRPVITPPPGWAVLAGHGATSVGAPGSGPTVRVAPARPRRVRTRSS